MTARNMMRRVPPPRKRPAPDSTSEIRRRSMSPAYWPQAVAHLSASDDILARIIAAFPSERLVCREDPFGTLARSIVGQQISVKAASSVWQRLEGALGELSEESVEGAPGDALLGCGLSRQKLRYLKDLAGHFASGAIDPSRWSDMDDEQVISELTTVKGIGRWTAEMFLIFNLMRPDVLPLDDIGLQRAMGLHYRGEGKLERKEMESVAAPWQPWRSVATWYLWRSLDPLPVEY
ncbi:MAG: DNA-3-methyladenine glycosylase family protein [Alphaproteobacteria bacterium]